MHARQLVPNIGMTEEHARTVLLLLLLDSVCAYSGARPSSKRTNAHCTDDLRTYTLLLLLYYYTTLV